MAAKKENKDALITVFGCTGSQGGSVVKYLMEDGYKVRGVTRDKSKDECKELMNKGVEMVEANIAKDSMDQLAKCLQGSYGAFLLTNFWDPESMGKEAEQGKKLVDAAKKAGVKHLFWATLPNVKRISNGKYKVPHFSDKALVQEYIEEMQKKTPKPFQHVTFIAAAFYYQNFENFLPVKKDSNGVFVFKLPDTRMLTAFDVNELGLGVVTALAHPDEFNMKRIDYYGEHAPLQHYVDTFTKVTGQKARLEAVPRDQWAKSGQQGAEEFADMFGWFNEYTYFGPDGNPEFGKKGTQGKLSNWETYLRKSGWKGSD
jgi:uncharacterized protein YbjT (DUF2867 family)